MSSRLLLENNELVKVAEVVLDIPTRALDSSFTYLVPSGMDVKVGQCVEVEFSHHPSIGYVMDISERPAKDFGDISLLPISSIRSESYFDGVSAELARWIAREYLSTLPETVRLFMPPGASPKFRKLSNGEYEYVEPKVAPVDDRWAMLTEQGMSYVPRKSATKQAAVIEALRAGEMRVAELGIEIDSVSSVLKTLEEKGVVRTERRRKMRGMGEVSSRSRDIENLTAGQREALSKINCSVDDGKGDVVVVDGVTGSGKTEVYLQAIGHVLKNGGSACVLVPEISLTPQTVGRFRSRFGDLVAVLHSRLSVGERYDQWSLIRSGEARVVVGARSALFAPLTDLKLIVIDEEHESSYKQGSSPRYTSRDVAVKLAELRGATLVLGSASPAIETLYNCQIGKWSRVVLNERASGKPLPPVQVVDLGGEFGDGNRTMYSKALVKALQETMDKGEKAVLLLNRRGFASFLLCRECGYVPTCEHCSTSMTFHESRRRGGKGNGGKTGFLMCHHCGSRMPAPARCPECGSPYLRQLGPGTQFAADQLRALLGQDVPIVRMDADTTRNKGAHEKLLGEFAAADRGVLLGTQMIAKGLDFPDVTLAGVLIADTTLKLPDFRASERTFQLIEQVAGRAGRAEREGRVIVQTYWPNHPAIVAASKHDRKMFLDSELPIRKELGYPPYKRLANILIWGKDEKAVMRESTVLREALDDRFGIINGKGSLFEDAPVQVEDRGDLEGWEILGPSPCLLSKLRGTFRWHILVKAPIGADIPGVLGPIFRQRKASESVSLAVDVDPVDLF
ncbi:MAG: replication restart helicase PriA [Coriobacteriales bacterium]|jgi:primosomal protein N' (replication factor Y)